MYPDIGDSIKHNLYNNYVAPVKSAVGAGNKQGISESVGQNSLIAGFASGGIGAAISRVNTPQQVLAAAGGVALGVATGYVVGFISGFGQSLGMWGK